MGNTVKASRRFRSCCALHRRVKIEANLKDATEAKRPALNRLAGIFAISTEVSLAAEERFPLPGAPELKSGR
jgi:hypothetical protein